MFDPYPLIWPVLRCVDPETAHGLAIGALKRGLVPRPPAFENAALRTTLLGRTFANPIGLAAGFDKNAEVYAPLFGWGFGFVEVGSVTPRPQPGNPKPRLFRLIEDRGIVNRMGFNNIGADAVAALLAKRHQMGEDLRRTRYYRDEAPGGVLGVNLGKNKDSADAAGDFVIGVEKLGPYADYLVVNVSSPNTPGLRALQGRGPLEDLLGAVGDARNKLENRPPVLLKIAPDLTSEDEADIAAVVTAGGADGLIVSNTTIERPAALQSANAREGGGLSGRPLFAPSTALLGRMYGLTGGQVPIVGVGGVEDGAGAYAKIRAGASLVQVYSALVYQGPALVSRIKRDLLACLQRDGFATVADAVGADHR